MDIKDIHVNITRKEGVKHINLKVCPPDGRVEVTAPLGTEDAEIRSFIITKWTWIKKTQRDLTEIVRQGERDFEGSETHYFLGERYRLRIIEKTVVPHTVEIKGEWIEMTIHPDTAKKNRGELLWEFYREKLKEILSEMVPRKAAEYGEEDVTWEIKKMRTEWGSCMTKRRHMLFNLELARLPLKCIEYIVVHELTHLQERLHNDRFIELMDQRMPMWRSIRQELNSFPATKYEYTPAWKKEISRIADVINERSILNLSVILSFLNYCLENGAGNEDFSLAGNTSGLRPLYDGLCPLSSVTLEQAIAQCSDAEYYKRTNDGIAIKAIWVEALEDRVFLEEVVKHCKKVLGKSAAKFEKNASHVEPVEDTTEESEQPYRLSRDKKTLVRVSRDATSFDIPEGVTVIGQNAFYGCKDLTDVRIPKSVARIEAGAFRGCTALEDIDVPASVMKVASDAFDNSGISQDSADEIYHDQGYFTPSVIDGLPPINVLVYSGKEDLAVAKEHFGVKSGKKPGREGSAYMIEKTGSEEDFAKEIGSLIEYAKDNANVRFVVRQSAFEGVSLDDAAEAFEGAYGLDNMILPFELYNAVDEIVNLKVMVDSVARYRFGGVINFSYVVNAVSVSSDESENERIQKALTDYNCKHAKEMLQPLCKRYHTGMSIHPNAGLYIGEDDQFYDEGSFEVRIIGVRSEQLKRIATEICTIFVQESVLVRDEVKNEIYFLYSPVMNVRKHPALAGETKEK